MLKIWTTQTVNSHLSSFSCSLTTSSKHIQLLRSVSHQWYGTVTLLMTFSGCFSNRVSTFSRHALAQRSRDVLYLTRGKRWSRITRRDSISSADSLIMTEVSSSARPVFFCVWQSSEGQSRSRALSLSFPPPPKSLTSPEKLGRKRPKVSGSGWLAHSAL